MLERLKEQSTSESFKDLLRSTDTIARCPETGAELQQNGHQWIFVYGEEYRRKSRQDTSEALAIRWGNSILARIVKEQQATAQRDVKRRARLFISNAIQTVISEAWIVENMIEQGWTKEEAVQIEIEVRKIAKRLAQQADK